MHPPFEASAVESVEGAADTQGMDEPGEREIDALLEQLEEEERDISLRRQRLHDRIATFPNPTTKAELERREREISDERRKLHRRIDDLRARRNELRSQHDEAER